MLIADSINAPYTLCAQFMQVSKHALCTLHATKVFVLPCCICGAMLYLWCHLVFVAPFSICVAMLYLCSHVVFMSIQNYQAYLQKYFLTIFPKIFVKQKSKKKFGKFLRIKSISECSTVLATSKGPH